MTGKRRRKKQILKMLYPLMKESAQLLSYLNQRRRFRAGKTVRNESGVKTFLKYTNRALAEIDMELQFVVDQVLELNGRPVSKRSMLSDLIKEIVKRKKYFSFDFVGLRWNPIANNARVIPWALASSLVQDIYKHPQRLKICSICDDFFWDGQCKNNTRKICAEEECINKRNVLKVLKSKE